MKADLFRYNLSDYKRFFEKGVLLDTGPLMLLFYGEFDKKYGTQFKSKINYTDKDYEVFNTFIRGVPTSKFIITPHIFHEFYKHAQRDFPGRFQDFFNDCFDKLIQMEEKQTKTEDLLTHNMFFELEIGEHSLVCSCSNDKTSAIIHDERHLCGKLKKNERILTISFKEQIKPWILTLS